jgi:hypothetical protein
MKPPDDSGGFLFFYGEKRVERREKRVGYSLSSLF